MLGTGGALFEKQNALPTIQLGVRAARRPPRPSLDDDAIESPTGAPARVESARAFTAIGAIACSSIGSKCLTKSRSHQETL